tara:strand:+ start:4680 stop:6485 length:1806 start_codon:yes stop_codon:yes gene_type:complete
MTDQLLRRLSTSKKVVLDVETSGLDWKSNYAVGYVFTFSADPNDSYYIPVRHRSNNVNSFTPPEEEKCVNPKSHPFEMDINSVFKSKTIHIIGHNLAFDLKFLHKHNIDLSKCTFEDTMINAGLINEYRSSYSLENCCIDAGVQPKRGGELYQYLKSQFGGHDGSKQMANYWRLDGQDDMGTEYAKGDGTSTYQLWEQQQKDLDKQDLRQVWALENKVIRVLHRMVVRGVNIDEKRLVEVSKLVEDRLIEANDALPKDLNIRSGAQMKALFDKHNITDYPITSKGNPSFTEAYLLTNELGKKIVGARKYGNLLNSFISPMNTHIFNSRIHTEFNQSRSDHFGTITGRLSSSRPNMQQVPKRNKELGQLFRSVFIPDKDMIWGSVDYSQCEPRLLAHYSKCKVLLSGYLSTPPIDAHTAVANAAGIDRDSGKRLNQGLLTGMGKAKLIDELGVSQSKGERIWDDYFASMPEIKVLQKKAASKMRSVGYVKSIMGRRARLDKRSGYDMSYKAINRLLQCGNADIIKEAMVNIDNYLEANGDRVHMLLSIHDSIDFQFHEDDRQDFNTALEIMQDFGPKKSVDLQVPMVVDVGEGKNWSEASYG